METMTLSSLTINNKLDNLVSFLRAIHKGFEQIAEEVDNFNLKMAIKAMAIESSQYAREIIIQFKKFNTNIKVAEYEDLWAEVENTVNQQAALTHGGEILEFCNNAEHRVKKLYGEVLEEPLLYSSIKSVITYQLYAAECAFMKIKLLNEMRFT